MPPNKIKPVIISGMCRCGHSWERHHLSLIVKKTYMDKLLEVAPNHPGYIPDECCFYGNNEVGGMKYNEETEEWEVHCYGYVDIEDTEEE